jgi:hypothetical protein
MNKKLLLVWGLWLLQAVGCVGFSAYLKVAHEGVGSTYQMAQQLADSRTDSWVIFAALCSGFFVLLTTWAMKPLSPSIATT